MIIHDCEQNSHEWFALKIGKPSGSRASSLVTPTGKASSGVDAYAVELANELYLGQSASEVGWSGNKHTERGHEQEPIAAALYSALYGVELQVVGFCTDDNNRYGISPDRLAGENGLVEIKCLDDQAHTTALVHYHNTRKPMPDRIAQCQMQLFVSGREYVDLFYYHKLLPELCIRILPIKTYFEMLECQLDEVIEKRDSIIEILNAA